MPRCFMPKKQKSRPAMTERTTGRRSPSPCVDLPPPPPPPPLANEEVDEEASVSSKAASTNVYRPPTPVNHTGKCRSGQHVPSLSRLSINVSALRHASVALGLVLLRTQWPSHFGQILKAPKERMRERESLYSSRPSTSATRTV